MKIEVINDAITKIENLETTPENVQDLAALYIVRTYLTKQQNRSGEQPDASGLKIQKELSDILPSYCRYCEQKKLFQMNQVSEESLLLYMTAVCKEIREFIETLYNCTDCQKERLLIRKMLSDIEIS